MGSGAAKQKGSKYETSDETAPLADSERSSLPDVATAAPDDGGDGIERSEASTASIKKHSSSKSCKSIARQDSKAWVEEMQGSGSQPGPLKGSVKTVVKYARHLTSCFVAAPELREYRPHVDFINVCAAPATSLETYVQTIIAEVRRVLKADRCSVFFVDDVRQEVWCVGALDMEPFSMPWDQGIVGLVAQEGKVINVADAHAHKAFCPTVEQRTGYTVETLLSLPIQHIVHDYTIGVIQVLNKLPEKTGEQTHFMQDDVNELQKIAMVISDSFYRQRWKALESGPSLGDNEALSVIAEQNRAPNNRSSQGRTSCQVDGVDYPLNSFALDTFQWGSELPPELAESGRQGVMSLQFDALQHTPDELAKLAIDIIHHTGAVETCSIPDKRLAGWVAAVKNLYRDNPFHNWFHGFSVFQMCYAQLYTSGLANLLQELDVFALLIAGLCHDLDHPAFTNGYLIDSGNELALRHNDLSVLENHHAYLACELLRKPETAIWSGLDPVGQKTLRRNIIKSILDTDMARHSELLQRILACLGQGLGGFAVDRAEDRQLVMSLCIHSADLSAQTLPWATAAQWEGRISQEFANQAKEEVAAGREPFPFMNVRLDDLKQRGKLQRDFIDFVLVPLWDPYSQLVPEMRPCYEGLKRNRGLYDHRFQHGCDSEDANE